MGAGTQAAEKGTLVGKSGRLLRRGAGVSGGDGPASVSVGKTIT